MHSQYELFPENKNRPFCYNTDLPQKVCELDFTIDFPLPLFQPSKTIDNFDEIYAEDDFWTRKSSEDIQEVNWFYRIKGYN